MKKFLFMIVVALATLSANAQLKWGIEGGLNLNKISVKNLGSADARAGFFIGPKIQFGLPLTSLNVDAALQYSQTSIRLSDEDTKTLPSVILPINLKYVIGLGSVAGVYLSTGPQANFNFASDVSLYNFNLFSQKTVTWNWNFGVGVHLLKHIQAGITYSLAIGDQLTIGDAILATKAKNNIWQVRVAYMF